MLRIDGLTVRFYDQSALDAYTRAWAEGLACAEAAFGPGQTPRLQTLMHWASQQARTPYRLDGLSADNRQLPGAASPIERSSEMRSV